MYDSDGFFDEPAGYSDADIEQNELERLGRASARARERGECTHGSRQGESGPDRPGPDDMATCLDCGKRASEAELNAEMHDALGM